MDISKTVLSQVAFAVGKVWISAFRAAAFASGIRSNGAIEFVVVVETSGARSFRIKVIIVIGWKRPDRTSAPATDIFADKVAPLVLPHAQP